MSQGSPFDVWIRSLDEADVERRLHEVQRQLDALQAEYKRLRLALALKRSWQEAMGEPASDSDEEIDLSQPMQTVFAAHFGLDAATPPTGKADAILRVMGTDVGREWAPREVYEVMVRMGWTPDTDGDFDSVVATLSRLAKDRRIHRPRRGIYRLGAPPAQQVETR